MRKLNRKLKEKVVEKIEEVEELEEIKIETQIKKKQIEKVELGSAFEENNHIRENKNIKKQWEANNLFNLRQLEEKYRKMRQTLDRENKQDFKDPVMERRARPSPSKKPIFLKTPGSSTPRDGPRLQTGSSIPYSPRAGGETPMLSLLASPREMRGSELYSPRGGQTAGFKPEIRTNFLTVSSKIILPDIPPNKSSKNIAQTTRGNPYSQPLIDLGNERKGKN